MATHELKCWPEPFKAVLDGKKTHEIRKTDRDFHEGDELLLREWAPTVPRGYTGREVYARVTYLSPPGMFGLPEGLCVMSLQLVRKEGVR